MDRGKSNETNADELMGGTTLARQYPQLRYRGLPFAVGRRNVAFSVDFKHTVLYIEQLITLLLTIYDTL
jgi:hypothetical protein